MSNLKKICQEVIEAGEKALIGSHKDNMVYEELASMYADKIARAASVMEEAMTKVGYKLNHNDSLIISQALAQAEELLK